MMCTCLLRTVTKASETLRCLLKLPQRKRKMARKEPETKETGWEGKVIQNTYCRSVFGAELKEIEDAETIIREVQAELDEVIGDAEEDSVINDVLKDRKFNKEKRKFN